MWTTAAYKIVTLVTKNDSKEYREQNNVSRSDVILSKFKVLCPKRQKPISTGLVSFSQ